MQGLKIGHSSDFAKGTGVTVFLFEAGAVGGYWMCGSAPATREIAVLDPANSVPKCHGLVFSGGSAYGLHSAAGAMRYLGERGIGQPVPAGAVPIVPTAALYDMSFQEAAFPSVEQSYEACLASTENNIERGRLGAGTGATVGKLIPGAHSMTGGLGRAVLTLANGLEVIAYAAVNCAGDVMTDGKVMAGCCNAAGEFINAEHYLLAGHTEKEFFTGANTTLAAIFTNAKLDKSSCQRTAKMAAAGLARAVAPAFTHYDGDIIFCMSLGDIETSELTLGTLAAEALRLAILDAVRETEIIKE